MLKSIEESVNLFDPVMRELKSRINEVFNLKEMCVRVLEEDLETLVEMFQQLGRRWLPNDLRPQALESWQTARDRHLSP